MTDQTDNESPVSAPMAVWGEPPVPLTPAQTTRFIIETDATRPNNTMIRVLEDGAWVLVGCITSLSFYADAAGAIKIQAVLAKCPEGADPESEAWKRTEKMVETNRNRLLLVGVEVV